MAVRGDGARWSWTTHVTPPLTGASLRLVNLDTDAAPVDAWLGDEPWRWACRRTCPRPGSTSGRDPHADHERARTTGSRCSRARTSYSGDGSAVTAFMVPTEERAVWFLADDASPAIAPDASASPGPSIVAGTVDRPATVDRPEPRSTADPDALAWRVLPVYECELMIAFTTDVESTSTRLTGSAGSGACLTTGRAGAVPLPRDARGDPLSGWALGPDGWTCVRHLAGDFDTSVSGLTIRSAGAGRAAAAACGAFGCDPAVGARTGRFIAYGSSAGVASRTQPPSTMVPRARPRAPTTGGSGRRATPNAAGSRPAMGDAMCRGAPRTGRSGWASHGRGRATRW